MSRMMLNDPENVAHIAQVRATLGFTPRDDLPDAFVGGVDVRQVETAKAPLLRKLLNQMLRTHLAGEPEKRPGGELVYETLWGMDTGWRYLTEENAARSICSIACCYLSQGR